MGSGLILLVIVLAWLAVLVPMALRSYDVSSSFGGVDRFSVAMRVLSRRGRSAGADDAETEPERAEPATVRVTRPARTVERDLADDLLEPVVPRPRAAAPAAPRPAPSAARAAALRRRQRLTLGLVALAALTLIAGLLGVPGMLLVHAAADGLLLAFAVHLRRQAAARARRLSAAPVRVPRPRPVDAVAQAAARSTSHGEAVRVRPGTPLRPPVHVAGVPDRMPPRQTPRTAPARLPMTGTDAAPARGAVGAPWSPVPVPVPTYVNAPVAPRPPAARDEELADAERDLGIVDEGPQLDQILERRRAVNEW